MNSESRQHSQTPQPLIGGAQQQQRQQHSVALVGGRLFPHLTLTYVRAARGAYNMCVKLVRQLNAPWMILVTAMSYWHCFFFFSLANGANEEDNDDGQQAPSPLGGSPSKINNSNGGRQQLHKGKRNPHITFEAYHPVLVAITSIFLALKAECVHKSLQQIIFAAFDIKSNTAPQYATRRQQILSLELMLMHTLEWNLFQELPWTRAMELLPAQQPQQQQQQPQIAAAAGAAKKATPAGTVAPEEMHRLFQRLLGYIVQLPYQTKLTGTAIAECAVWFVADSLDALTETLAAKLTSVDGATFAAFSTHLVELIAQFDPSKFNDVPKVQAMVIALRSRMRENSNSVSSSVVLGGVFGGNNNNNTNNFQSPSIATPTTCTSAQLSTNHHAAAGGFPSGVVNSSGSLNQNGNVGGGSGGGGGNGISPPPMLSSQGQRQPPPAPPPPGGRIRGRDEGTQQPFPSRPPADQQLGQENGRDGR